jgi:hypothetical protein
MMERDLEAVAERAAVAALAAVTPRLMEHVARELRAALEEVKGGGNPVSPHCDRVLATPPPCTGFREIRSWVLCRSWEKMEKEGLKRLPVGEAWREARTVCYLSETEIPEKKRELERLRGKPSA